MSELKPCPFCGGNANAIPSEHADDCYFMVMRKAKLEKDSADCSFIFDAIEAWNRRAQSAQQAQAEIRKADVARTCPFCNEEWVEQPQAEAVPSDVVRDADVEAAAKKMAEIFDYPWDFMPEKGRNTMRENVRAVLTAAQGEKP